jgi:hypothetical protein
MRLSRNIVRFVAVLFWPGVIGMELTVEAQFVRLQGRQFMVNGENFYPMAVNYGFELTSPDSAVADTSQLYLTPEGAYDRNVNSHFECQNPAECDDQIIEHLTQVKAMGFNAIRCVGGFSATNLRGATGQRYYATTVHVNQPWGAVYRLFMDFPGFEGPVAQKVFGLYRHLLDLCDSMDVKVILLSGGRVRSEPPGSGGWLTYTTADAEAYSRYLARLAAELKDHPALMAYDLWNEPRWGNDSTHLQTKQTVCEWTTMFYDTLKHHDPNHLVTLGGSHSSELNSWDPLVMKLDFYAPHFYPSVEPFGAYDVEASFDEMRAEMFWLGKTCPMPWMIGETAFSADDDTTDNGTDSNWVCLLPGPEFHRMPWMWGNEDQQVQYALQSMDAVRNSLGSGYAWWDFQSNKSTPVLRNDSLRTPLEVNGSWMSVLGFGDGVNRWRIKKLADTLDSYVPPLAPLELHLETANYPSWLGIESDSVQTWGWVRDQNYEPIADAVIEWGWNYSTDQNSNPMLFPNDNAWDRITTRADGYFEVPKAPFHPTGWIRLPDIGEPSLAAPGGMGYAGLDGNAPGTVYQIERYRPFARDTTPFAWPGIGDTVRYRAYIDLFVRDQFHSGNGTVGAVADYSARLNVHVIGEFHAQQGSEVHLFNEQVWPDCNNTALRTAIQVIEPTAVARRTENDQQERALLLRFAPEENGLEIIPNPATTEIFVISATPAGTYRIIDGQGRTCRSVPSMATRTVIDVSELANGRYELQHHTNTWTGTKAFVIQR